MGRCSFGVVCGMQGASFRVFYRSSSSELVSFVDSPSLCADRRVTVVTDTRMQDIGDMMDWHMGTAAGDGDRQGAAGPCAC